jgi:hypothetical protein
MYSKPSIFRINGEEVIQINRKSGLMEQKIALKEIKLKKQINGRLNNIGSADERKYKNITAAISSTVRSYNPGFSPCSSSQS